MNVFALGIVDRAKIFKSNTATAGSSVMIWGAKTGRDGIHGASLLASADFKEGESENKEQKIRVQVGDPFREKCLMDACLEVMDELSDDLIAIQDMGAAGLTCSTMEIASKSEIGMTVELDKVPVREKAMTAYELLLSESQERMLAIVKKGSEEKFKKVMQKWWCEAETIGETTSDKLLKMTYQGQEVVNLPADKLIDPPEAKLPEAESLSQGKLFDVKASQNELAIEDVREEWKVLSYLLSLPRIASKKNVYEQYDCSVGASTVMGPGQEAAVLWVGNEKHPHLGVAFKGACDEALAASFPRFAAMSSVAECVRALACVGAKALALTDGVNMGNPQSSHVLGLLSETVDGLNEAMAAFDTPCVGGNVSLYNQTLIGEEKRDIKPTTFAVLVGKIEDVRKCRPSVFQKAGNEVWLLSVSGDQQKLPHGSLYSRCFWPDEMKMKDIPYLNLDQEKNLQEALLTAHDQELFISVRDVGDGGLAVSLAEACFENEALSFEGDFSKFQKRRDQLLFGEGGGRVICEIDGKNRAQIMKLARDFGLETKKIGEVVESENFAIRPLLRGPLAELKKSWSETIK